MISTRLSYRSLYPYEPGVFRKSSHRIDSKSSAISPHQWPMSPNMYSIRTTATAADISSTPNIMNAKVARMK